MTEFDQKEVFSLLQQLDLRLFSFLFFLHHYRFNLLGLIGFFMETQGDKWCKMWGLFFPLTRLHGVDGVCYLQIKCAVR